MFLSFSSSSSSLNSVFIFSYIHTLCSSFFSIFEIIFTFQVLRFHIYVLFFFSTPFSLHFLISPSFFLSSFLPSFFPSFLPFFFLSFLLSFLPSFLPFLPSFIHSFFYSKLPSSVIVLIHPLSSHYTVHLMSNIFSYLNSFFFLSYTLLLLSPLSS